MGFSFSFSFHPRILTVVRKRTLAQEWCFWGNNATLGRTAAAPARITCASEILRWQGSGPESVSIRVRVITTLN
jgi:hypothetical protein